jgi:large subunit ribosomal protein L10
LPLWKKEKMANEKNIKKVEELKQKFDDSHGVILAEYRGLTVPEIADLREKIYQNSTFEVTKNTLLKIAAKDKGFSDDFISVLQGPTAVAFVKDDPYAL